MNDLFYERFIKPIEHLPEDSQGIWNTFLVSKKQLIDFGFTVINPLIPEDKKYDVFYYESRVK